MCSTCFQGQSRIKLQMKTVFSLGETKGTVEQFPRSQASKQECKNFFLPIKSSGNHI